MGSIGRRSARFREAVEIITHLLRNDAPLTFEGRFYQLREAVVLPRPKRPGGPRIVVGGPGRNVSLPLAAKHADEWNVAFRSVDQFRELNTELDRLLAGAGRPATSVRRTLMTNVQFGRTDAELQARLAQRAMPEPLRHAAIIGTPSQVRDRVAELEASGVQRVMLQWLDLDDTAAIAALGQALAS